jgi:hypothetical protein
MEWNGTQLVRIGEAILDELESLIDPSDFSTIFAEVLLGRQEYWLVVDSDNVFVYDWVRKTWSRDTYPSLTAVGEGHDAVGSTLWDDLSGSWDSLRETWESLGGVLRLKAFGGRASGEMFEIDRTLAHDYFAIGSIVDRLIETPDFYFTNVEGVISPWFQGTIQQVLLIYNYVNGEPFEVGISTDRGSTWTTQSVVPSPSGFSVLTFNLTGNIARFRFREANADGFFRWRSYVYEFVDAGPFRPS